MASGSADVDCVRRLVLADVGARNRIAGGSVAVAAGAGRVEHSCVCAAAYRELVVHAVVVCRVGTMGAGKRSALVALVLSPFDVAVGQPAWRMAAGDDVARDLCARGLCREPARVGRYRSDSERASGARYVVDVCRFRRSYGRESV